MTIQQTIGEYLISKLAAHGVRHAFGVPEIAISDFYDVLERHHGIRLITTIDERAAGLAADAYARINGLAAVCVACGPHTLHLAATTAQAYAGKSPVVVIGLTQETPETRRAQPYTHPIWSFDVRKQLFDDCTVASAVLDTPSTAATEVDRVVSMARERRLPVYIELPLDVAFTLCPAGSVKRQEKQASHPENMNEAIRETAARINGASRPAILAGVEVLRFGLQKELISLAKGKGIPVAAVMPAKSVLTDKQDFYMGIYAEGIGREDVRSYVENSDCLLLLGTAATDLRLDRPGSLSATSEGIVIAHRRFENILFPDFMKALVLAPITPRRLDEIPHPPPPRPVARRSRAQLTVDVLFEHLNAYLKKNTMVIADIGDAVIGTINLYLHRTTKILLPANCAAAGSAVPGALGAQLAAPDLRPLVVVGNEAFHMTGMELSTIARHGLSPIIIILNGQDQGTAKSHAGRHFDNIQPWHYSKVPAVIGSGIGFIAETEEDLERALLNADRNTGGFTIIDVLLNTRTPRQQ